MNNHLRNSFLFITLTVITGLSFNLPSLSQEWQPLLMAEHLKAGILTPLFYPRKIIITKELKNDEIVFI